MCYGKQKRNRCRIFLTGKNTKLEFVRKNFNICKFYLVQQINPVNEDLLILHKIFRLKSAFIIVLNNCYSKYHYDIIPLY